MNHGGEVEVVGIQSNVDLGDSPPNPVSPPTRWSTIGFDVDERCSFVPDLRKNQECHLPSYAVGVPDGPRGQDNALGKVIQTVRDKLVIDFTSGNYTRSIQAGMSSGIARVRGYNGEPNDDQVSVANMASASFDAFARAQGAPDGSVSPRWDGNDVWPVASYSVSNENVDAPMYEDNNAYVTNGRLVANYPDFKIRLIVGLSTIKTVDLTLDMHGVVLGCDLEKTKIGRWGWALKNCTLSARVSARKLIAQLSHFANLSDTKPGPLCTDSALYPGFKTSICQLVDVSTFPGTADCDALSFNANFDTVPGYLGNVFTVEPVEELCDPKSPKTWPSNDSCESLLSAGDGGR